MDFVTCVFLMGFYVCLFVCALLYLCPVLFVSPANRYADEDVPLHRPDWLAGSYNPSRGWLQPEPPENEGAKMAAVWRTAGIQTHLPQAANQPLLLVVVALPLI